MRLSSASDHAVQFNCCCWNEVYWSHEWHSADEESADWPVMPFLLLCNERAVVCVCVLAGSLSHGLRCKFRLCDILSPFLPLAQPRVDLFIPHFHRAPSFPLSSTSRACLTVICNPRGIPLFNYLSTHPSIHPSVSRSPRLYAQLHLHLSCCPPFMCSSYFALMCFLWPLWGITPNPLPSSPGFPFFAARFAPPGGAQVHTAGLY